MRKLLCLIMAAAIMVVGCGKSESEKIAESAFIEAFSETTTTGKPLSENDITCFDLFMDRTNEYVGQDVEIEIMLLEKDFYNNKTAPEGYAFKRNGKPYYKGYYGIFALYYCFVYMPISIDIENCQTYKIHGKVYTTIYNADRNYDSEYVPIIIADSVEPTD